MRNRLSARPGSPPSGEAFSLVRDFASGREAAAPRCGHRGTWLRECGVEQIQLHVDGRTLAPRPSVDGGDGGACAANVTGFGVTTGTDPEMAPKELSSP
jgi:hypothetical protein